MYSLEEYIEDLTGSNLLSDSASDMSIETETRICKFQFQYGGCRDGESCAYSHDPLRVNVCRFFSKGTCRHGSKCWFRHERNGKEDQRERFNVTKYKTAELARLKILAEKKQKKAKEEFLLYSAEPYAEPTKDNLAELEFDEAMRKMREFRKLYFPLHRKNGDLSWVDDRVTQAKKETKDVGKLQKMLCTYSNHSYLLNEVNEREKAEKSLNEENRKKSSDGTQKITTSMSKENEKNEPPKVTASVPEENEPEKVMEIVPEENEPEKVTATVPEENEPEKVTATVPEENEPEKVTATVAEENEPEKVTATVPEENEPEKVTAIVPEENEPEKVTATVAEENVPEKVTAIVPEENEPNEKKNETEAGKKCMEEANNKVNAQIASSNTESEEMSAENASMIETDDNKHQSSVTEEKDESLVDRLRSPNPGCLDIQRNILAYRFSLDDLFANGHIRSWSMEQVIEFYDEARQGEFPWPELCSLLFEVHRPRPKAWAQFFKKFLFKEVYIEDLDRLVEEDDESGLIMEDITLLELLSMWMQEPDVNELHIGGLLAGLMELDPECYTIEHLAKMTDYIAGFQPIFSNGYTKCRAFLALGFGRCVSFETLCKFLHVLLEIAPCDDDDPFKQALCSCQSFECNCPRECSGDWEEAGHILGILCDHLCANNNQRKHELFAKATKHVWQAPTLAIMYHEYVEPNCENPLEGCEPAPMSDENMKNSILRNFSKEHQEYLKRVLSLKEPTDEKHRKGVKHAEQKRPSSCGSCTGGSESEAASSNVSKNSPKKPREKISASSPISIFSDDFYNQYSDYADEMSDDDLHLQNGQPDIRKTPQGRRNSQRNKPAKKESVKKVKEKVVDTQKGRKSSPNREGSTIKPNETKGHGDGKGGRGNKKGKETKEKSTSTETTRASISADMKRLSVGDSSAQTKEDEPSKKRTEEKVKCKGMYGNQACCNYPKTECIRNMCRRCCEKVGGRHCEPHCEPRNIMEAIERLAQPCEDKWDDNMEYYTIVPSKHFDKREDFESFLSQNPPMLRRVSFGSYFGIEDDHVIRVAETFNKHLQVLELGCNESGEGSHLSEKSVSAITQHCPNIVKLKLESCTKIADPALVEIWHSCSKLKHIQITGHDKREGKVTKKGLKPLFDDLTLAPHLRFICLHDQAVNPDVISRLKRARPQLAVVYGSTAEDFLEKMGFGYSSMF